jgi:ATP-binding cassette subfamily F protein 2
MESIDALARAIKEFEGGVVVVSHDFRLISQVAEELWEVKNKKIVNLTKQVECLDPILFFFFSHQLDPW